MHDARNPNADDGSNARLEIASLLARGYIRHRRLVAVRRAGVCANPVNIPLDDVPPQGKVRGRGDEASQEEKRK